MATSNWKIDTTHSGVHFTVRHMVITKVRGAFRAFEGTIALDESDITKSSVNVSIDAASIDTAEPKRDGHLKSQDFFDVEKFPKLTFASTGVTKNGDALSVTGNLTLHGVTKQVTLDAALEGRGKDPWGGERISFTAKTSLNREDYDLKWNQALEAGGLLVGTKIEIELDIQAVKG